MSTNDSSDTSQMAEALAPPGAAGRALERVLRVCQHLGMVVVLALMLVTVVQVTSRYVFNHPFEGVVDVSSMMVVTLVFLAGPYNFLVDRHIRVDMVLRRLSRPTRIGMELFMDVVCLAAVGLACWSTIKQGNAMAGTGQVSRTAHIPYYPFFYVVAFGWFLSALAVLGHMASLALEARGGRR